MTEEGAEPPRKRSVGDQPSQPEAPTSGEIPPESRSYPTDEELLRELEVLYQKTSQLRAAWSVELVALQAMLPELRKKIAFNYRLLEPIGVGGGGIVFRARDLNLDTDRALKVARPSPGREEFLVHLLEEERSKLLHLSHANIIKVFAQGYASQYPWYVMQFIPGATGSDDYLSQPIEEARLLLLLRQILDAVAYLHSQDIVHLDIKPDNVLIDASGIPVITDLGAAKLLSQNDRETILFGTLGYMHPEMQERMTEPATDNNRLRGHAPQRIIKESWDLFGLGKTLFMLLGKVEQADVRALSPYVRRYLRLMACRMLDGHESGDERASGISANTYGEIAYRSVHDALDDIDKLIGRFRLEDQIPELNVLYPDTIQVSSLAPAAFSERVQHLVDASPLRRLANVSQLGLLNLVYPTATHTRFEHSFGTYVLCCRYVLALFNDPVNPLFRQLMTTEDLCSVLVAALLHDVGQYPMAHDLEEIDRDRFSHETRTVAIIGSPAFATSFREWGVSAPRLKAILEASAARSKMKGTLKDRILHSLVSGPLDADKLDYLTRDSERLSLTYGRVIDVDRLLICLTIAYYEWDNGTYGALAIHEKGKVIAEAVAFARYAMHRQAYWHHAFRAIKVMLFAVVCSAMEVASKADRLAAFTKEVHELIATVETQSEQGTLRLGEASSPNQPTRIIPSDRAVLDWFAERSELWGRAIADELLARRLYRRVLVLSERSEQTELIQKLLKLNSKSGMDWRQRVALQRGFQEQVRLMAEGSGGAGTMSAFLEASDRTEFISAATRMPVLLVDVPPEKLETPLEYVVEEGRSRSRVDGFRAEYLERSTVWAHLQEDFRMSAGKVRVFCHRSHAEFVSSYFSRAQLEKALAVAIAQITERVDERPAAKN